jgi:hypothetical protein
MRARSLALAVLAVALCSCAATSHFAADTAKGNPSDPVPWISATPSSMLLPTPSPTMIPAGTRPCQAADLQAVFGGIGAFTGGQLAASIRQSIRQRVRPPGRPSPPALRYRRTPDSADHQDR